MAGKEEQKRKAERLDRADQAGSGSDEERRDPAVRQEPAKRPQRVTREAADRNTERPNPERGKHRR